MPEMCVWLSEVGSDDTHRVGGKNASLGEMIRHLSELGIRVPDGFATTEDAYRRFLDANDLAGEIRDRVDRLRGGDDVAAAGAEIRELVLDAQLPDELVASISEHYQELSRRTGRPDVDVAVRSSATAEDLPDASFAGQQETYLNITGTDALLDACRRCYASLFTDRAVAYREEQGFDHLAVALSIGIQRMVRSDRAGAGVLFTVDTETGFPDVVVIDAAWGLGESVVSGAVDPDEYTVFTPLLGRPGFVPILSRRLGGKAHKVVYATSGSDPTEQVDTSDEERERFVLSDDEAVELARLGARIEDHYGMAMDVEWAKEGDTGELFVVQARPETVQSGRTGGTLRRYRLTETGDVLVEGHAIGEAIAAGPACALDNPAEGDAFPDGGVLVTGMTDPDWVPIMRRAAAIVTDHGGRTSHAAIVSRELGVPAVIGTGDATSRLTEGRKVTVSCAQGQVGVVYDGILAWDETELALEDIPATDTKVMLNLADPDAALSWWQLPADGIGLARMEFVVGNHVQAHPLALLHPEVVDAEDRGRLDSLAAGYEDGAAYFVDRLASGLARIAASQFPRPVIVRMSDFKTNEYAALIGGAVFEPDEENPMLGWRGASRYYHDDYREGFALECRAVRKVREVIGLDNVVVMIPFCRTPEEADEVLQAMAAEGLVRGRGGLQVYVMAEVPSNVVLVEEFASRFDGFSIGSNDLTQLLLGVDRDSALLRDLFDERDPAVARAIEWLVERAHQAGVPVGLCGQAPSDDADFAAFLVDVGIDSVSVAPDTFVTVKERVAAAERAR